MDCDLHVVFKAGDGDGDGGVAVAVLHGVADQVGENLSDAAGVPFAFCVAGDAQRDVAVVVQGFHFLHDLGTDARHIRGDAHGL